MPKHSSNHYRSLRTSFGGAALAVGASSLVLLSACGSDAPKASKEVAEATKGPTEAAHGSVDSASDAPFLDVTAEVGLDFLHFNGMSGGYYYSEMMGSGGAIFDADRDGRMDLFLVQGSMLGTKPIAEAAFPPTDPDNLSDRLWLGRKKEPGDGVGFRFEDVTESAGIRGPGDGYGMGVAAADFDGDGWTDLYVTQKGPNRLLRHRGLDDTGRPVFEDVTDEITGSRSWSVPAVPFDADGDGDMDLFLGNYVIYDESLDRKCPDELGRPNYCGPLTYPPAPDQLLVNVTEPGGPIRFEDHSGRAGIQREFGAALGAVAADFNGDGRLDIYVANDGNPNQLWISVGQGGELRFDNQALPAGAGVNGQGHAEASMGVAVADVDQDRDEDIFLTHLTRETHTLYINDGHGGFIDGSAESGLAGPSLDRTGFGTAFLDYDRDGLLDAVVAAGAVKVVKEQALAGDPHPLKQRNQLYRGVAPGRFVDVTDQAGPAFQDLAVGRAALVGDLDDDGDPDLVMTYNAGPAQVLLNTAAPAPWIGLRLVSNGPGTDGPGTDVPGAVARVRFSDGSERSARVGANAGYASVSDPRLLFAFGSMPSEPVHVDVEWPDGRHESWSDLAPGTYHTLRRGGGTPP